MIKRLIIFSCMALGIAIGSASCKKKGCMDENAENYNASATKDDGSCTYAEETPSAAQPGGYTPTFLANFGGLIAIKAQTTLDTPVGPYYSELGTAVAFFTEDSGNTFMDAGAVTCEGETLTLKANNNYNYDISTANLSGIAFDASVDWNATGGAWPAFSGSTTVGFPTVNEITSGDVTMSSNYTVTSSGVTNADSVYFAVYGPNGTVSQIKGPGNSHTFTAAQLSAIGAGNGYVQVVGIKYDPQTIGGKIYWFLDETARTKSVTIN